MSVLVQGIDVPEYCRRCALCHEDNSGDWAIVYWCMPLNIRIEKPLEKRKDCPLIQIPEPSDIRPILDEDPPKKVLDAQTGVYSLYDGEFPRTVEDKYTNFDHFKDMDEYDLASELQKNMHCNGCKLFRDGKYKCYLDDFTCIGRIIEWLREEYKND